MSNSVHFHLIDTGFLHFYWMFANWDDKQQIIILFISLGWQIVNQNAEINVNLYSDWPFTNWGDKQNYDLLFIIPVGK